MPSLNRHDSTRNWIISVVTRFPQYYASALSKIAIACSSFSDCVVPPALKQRAPLTRVAVGTARTTQWHPRLNI